MELAWQESLFEPTAAAEGGDAGGALDVPLSLAALARTPLDEGSWLDRIPGWLPDHAALFAQLLAGAPWQHRERWMYERKVLEPRLVAGYGADELGALPSRLRQAREVLGAYYGVEFDSVLVNLYRDGRDGVAWHGDNVRKRLEESVVVTVGLGERRRFLLRPGTSGPATVSLTSGEGDLIVMGGRCQHEWQHTVPKAAAAGARMSVTMRHSGVW